MSRVHLCLGRLADNPYTFEKSRVRVFSIEAVSYTHLTLPTTPYV